MRDATLHLRLDVGDRQAVDELAAQTGLTASAIARAGLRAVLADPQLLVAPKRERPPAVARPNGKRRRKR